MRCKAHPVQQNGVTTMDNAAQTSFTEFGIKRWFTIARRVTSELSADHVGLIAAGVAFYGLLAIFPAITAILAIGGLFLDPADILSQLGNLSVVVPDAAMQIITDQAAAVAGSREGGLGLAALTGIGIAIYSASKGMASLIEGMNVAYDVAETRGFFLRLAVTLALTLMVIVGLLSGLFAAVVIPALIAILNFGGIIEGAATVIAWIALTVATIAGLTLLYRFGPSHKRRPDSWWNVGALVSCVLWLVGSSIFGIYVANFASYNESFGALAGVIVLLTWLWLSAYIVLFGAELNSEINEELGLAPTADTDYAGQVV